MNNLTSTAEVTIAAPTSKVWEALVTPETIKQYMFGSDVVTEWKVEGPIVWKGDYQGKKYEDKGTILKLEEGSVLQYSHFSPLSGKPDVPENYHIVTIKLDNRGDETGVTLTQDNNPDEESVEYTKKFWQGMLDTMKGILEK
jgi:uncharacterized protein YndB with AHSA1/START domain